MSIDEPQQYKDFYAQFGMMLKEGIIEDHANRSEIAKLLRFNSTHQESADLSVSLHDYISRMKPNQKAIYYVVADSYSAAKNSPHLEIFKKKGVEVLLLSEKIDEWMVAHLTEFEGKSLQSVAKGQLEGDEWNDPAEKEQITQAEKTYEVVISKLKADLEGKVKEIRVSNRLTDSPSCIVADEYGLSMHLQKLLSAAGQGMPSSLPILEINPHHPFIEQLKSMENIDEFKDWAWILFEQAILSEGGNLEDPASFIKRVNRYLKV
jgi:molecular chaperone HtpG